MKVQLMSVAPYFKYLRTLQVLCATALEVHCNYPHTLVQKVSDLKVCDVISFCNNYCACCITLCTLRLMKESSDVNILDFGQGTASNFAVCDNNSQCITTRCTIEYHFIIVYL